MLPGDSSRSSFRLQRERGLCFSETVAVLEPGDAGASAGISPPSQSPVLRWPCRLVLVWRNTHPGGRWPVSVWILAAPWGLYSRASKSASHRGTVTDRCWVNGREEAWKAPSPCLAEGARGQRSSGPGAAGPAKASEG